MRARISCDLHLRWNAFWISSIKFSAAMLKLNLGHQRPRVGIKDGLGSVILRLQHEIFPRVVAARAKARAAI